MENNKLLIAILSSILNIFIGYLFQNLAYICNIYRWKLLTTSIKLNSENSSKSFEEDGLSQMDLQLALRMRNLKFLIAFFLFHSIVFTVLDAVQWPFYNISFLIIQGIIIDGFLVWEYWTVYTELKNYHEKLIEQNKGYLKDEEIETFRRSTNEVRIFFSYICA